MHNSKKAVFVGLALSSASSLVMAAPFAVEGKLSQMNIDTTTLGVAGAGNHVVCNGTTIYLSPTTVYSTPTGTITADKLISPTPFPGKLLVEPDAPSAPNSQGSAFIGGTCIIEGDEGSTPTSRVATSVFVEMAENVLVGSTTNAPGAPFEIMGVKVVLLAPKPIGTALVPAGSVVEPEERVVAVPVRNGTGMKVDINSVLKGDESSAEGYLGVTDGQKIFYAHTVITTGGTPVDKQNYSEASIFRADMTFSNTTTVKLDIRGGCTFVGATTPLPMVIQVDRGTVWVNALNGTLNSTVTTTPCTLDPATGQGTYRYRNDNFRASATPLPGTLPTKVRAFVGPAPTTKDPVTGVIPEPHYSETFPFNRLGFK
jgi:hypothetical protein